MTESHTVVLGAWINTHDIPVQPLSLRSTVVPVADPSMDTPPSTRTADRPFHVMVKPNGPTCNLECEYCYYLDKANLYPERADFGMPDETLETFIRQMIAAQPGSTVSFSWQGGEPTLLGLDFFRKVVEIQQRYASDGMEVQNNIQTNGTLLDDEWGEFLFANEFLVGISIDGPRHLHDEFRRTRGDTPTFDRVMAGLSTLQEYDVEHNVLCVVNAVNSRHPIDVYDFFKANDLAWMQFIPLVEPVNGDDTTNAEDVEPADQERRGVDHHIPDWVRKRNGDVTQRDDHYEDVVAAARAAPVSHRSVDPMVFGEFLASMFDEWVRNDIDTTSVRIVDQCLEVQFRERASLCVFSPTCGEQLAMEHNGDVYACDHFVDPGFKRGNIHDTHLASLVDDVEQRRFGEYKRDGLPERCRSCDVRRFCHGGCPKNWHLPTPAGAPGLNYLCAGYRYFFTYVQPYLGCVERTMADGLPFPSVMERVAVLDEHG